MSPSTKLSTDYSDMPSSKLPDLTGRYIGAGHYKLLKKIGQGSFGIVYLGQNTQTDPRELVAVKCSVEGRNTSIRLEIDLQTRAGAASSGVLGIQEVIEDEDWELTFIVTDYCPDGDLFDLIYDKSKRFFRNDERIRSTFLQILDGGRVVPCPGHLPSRPQTRKHTVRGRWQACRPHRLRVCHRRVLHIAVWHGHRGLHEPW